MKEHNRYKTKSIVISVAIALIMITGIIFFNNKKRSADSNILNNNPWSQESLARRGTGENSESITNDFNFTQTYTHTKYNFSFLYPETYSATTFFDEAVQADVVLVQEAEKGVGFQIQITPFDVDVPVLTAERVKRDLPSMTISDVQEIDLGEYGKGIAFMSNNENFGGSSREIWFVWKGYLYQISTYKYLDSILQAIMNTWEFK